MRQSSPEVFVDLIVRINAIADDECDRDSGASCGPSALRARHPSATEPGAPRIANANEIADFIYSIELQRQARCRA